jgi:hypothetical protein
MSAPLRATSGFRRPSGTRLESLAALSRSVVPPGPLRRCARSLIESPDSTTGAGPVGTVLYLARRFQRRVRVNDK